MGLKVWFKHIPYDWSTVSSGNVRGVILATLPSPVPCSGPAEHPVFWASWSPGKQCVFRQLVPGRTRGPAPPETTVSLLPGSSLEPRMLGQSEVGLITQ